MRKTKTVAKSHRLPGSRKKAERWPVPSCIPRSQVRPHLAAIVRHAGAGHIVHVGTSPESAYSAFVSLEELKVQKARFRTIPADIDIERLRSRWSAEREHVENTGRPLRVLRNGEAIAAFVPTPRAIRNKVARTVADMDKAQVALLGELGQRLARIETGVAAIESFITTAMDQFRDGQEAPSLQRLIGLARVVLKEWRESKGLDGQGPDSPPLIGAPHR